MSSILSLDRLRGELVASQGVTLLAPGPARRTEAMSAITSAYRKAYGHPPSYVVCVESPLAGSYAVGLVALEHYALLGLEPCAVDAATAAAAPVDLARDVRRQVREQAARGRPPVPLPQDRAVPPELALWASTMGAVEKALGEEVMVACLSAGSTLSFAQVGPAILNQLDDELPEGWFYYRDLFSFDAQCDARVIQLLTEQGVPGLELWQPFVEAARLVDHFWMRMGVVVVCDPPEWVEVAADGSGGVVRWSDGWSVAWPEGE